MSYFVDTNVLAYARDATEPEKQRRAHKWLESLWENQTGQLSYQVLQEYYVTVTQKLKPGMDIGDARDDVRSFQAWRPLSIDNRVLMMAWDVQDRFGFSWWDAQPLSGNQGLGTTPSHYPV